MIIIAESGATKTSWRSVDDEGRVHSVKTGGMSPTCLDKEYICSLVYEAMPLLNPLGAHVKAVYFYGAGLVATASVAPIHDALRKWCPDALVDFRSDLLAAARALFGDGDGIVAIMGTGSNSCLYRKGKIAMNFKPGGFILGDEGSAAALGKAFLSDYVKLLLPYEVERIFHAEYQMPYQDVVENVYRKPGAAAFLGSFAPFILKNIDEPTGYFRSLVDECLDSFMRTILVRYMEKADGGMKVGVVGSFGCACKEYVREAGKRYGLEFERFLNSPIDELVRYHGI